MVECLNGLGGVLVVSFVKLVEMCCFIFEEDGSFNVCNMIEYDLKVE